MKTTQEPPLTAAEVVAMIPKQYNAMLIDSDTEAICIDGEPYLGIIINAITDIEQDEVVVRIRTTGAVITLWKDIKSIHVTIL